MNKIVIISQIAALSLFIILIVLHEKEEADYKNKIEILSDSIAIKEKKIDSIEKILFEKEKKLLSLSKEIEAIEEVYEKNRIKYNLISLDSLIFRARH